MPRYTTLEEVKRVLKKGRKDRVHFPGAPSKAIAVEGTSTTSNYLKTISINRKKIYCDPCFEGALKIALEFTSATEFNLYKTFVGGPDFRPLLDGNGDINTEYITQDGDVTIEADAIGGAPKAGDIVQIEFEVHISEDRAEKFILDVETEVRATIKELLYDPVEIDADDELELICTYLSAYYMWIDVFLSDDIRDNRESFIERWKKRADDLLNMVIRTHGNETGGVAVYSFPATISEIGQRGIETGARLLSNRIDEPQVDSSGFFNSDFPNRYSDPYDN